MGKYSFHVRSFDVALGGRHGGFVLDGPLGRTFIELKNTGTVGLWDVYAGPYNNFSDPLNFTADLTNLVSDEVLDRLPGFVRNVLAPAFNHIQYNLTEYNSNTFARIVGDLIGIPAEIFTDGTVFSGAYYPGSRMTLKDLLTKLPGTTEVTFRSIDLTEELDRRAFIQIQQAKGVLPDGFVDPFHAGHGVTDAIARANREGVGISPGAGGSGPTPGWERKYGATSYGAALARLARENLVDIRVSSSDIHTNTNSTGSHSFYDLSHGGIPGGGSSSSGNSGFGGHPGKAKDDHIAPIVLDLNRDGKVDLVGQGSSTAFVDIKDNGFKHQVGWVGRQDGLLAVDIDGDGKITKTEEFAFANRTSEEDTDLEALVSLYDTNKDGVLDKLDADFGKFFVWRDANGDGGVDKGEIIKLSDVGIISINLTSDHNAQDIEGNHIAGQGSVTWKDGKEGIFADVGFSVSDFGYKITATDQGTSYEFTVEDAELGPNPTDKASTHLYKMLKTNDEDQLIFAVTAGYDLKKMRQQGLYISKP